MIDTAALWARLKEAEAAFDVFRGVDDPMMRLLAYEVQELYRRAAHAWAFYDEESLEAGRFLATFREAVDGIWFDTLAAVVVWKLSQLPWTSPAANPQVIRS